MVPKGVEAGEDFVTAVPGHREREILVPSGVKPGETIKFEVKQRSSTKPVKDSTTKTSGLFHQVQSAASNAVKQVYDMFKKSKIPKKEMIKMPRLQSLNGKANPEFLSADRVYSLETSIEQQRCASMCGSCINAVDTLQTERDCIPCKPVCENIFAGRKGIIRSLFPEDLNPAKSSSEASGEVHKKSPSAYAQRRGSSTVITPWAGPTLPPTAESFQVPTTFQAGDANDKQRLLAPGRGQVRIEVRKADEPFHTAAFTRPKFKSELPTFVIDYPDKQGDRPHSEAPPSSPFFPLFGHNVETSGLPSSFQRPQTSGMPFEEVEEATPMIRNVGSSQDDWDSKYPSLRPIPALPPLKQLHHPVNRPQDVFRHWDGKSMRVLNVLPETPGGMIDLDPHNWRSAPKEEEVPAGFSDAYTQVREGMNAAANAQLHFHAGRKDGVSYREYGDLPLVIANQMSP